MDIPEAIEEMQNHIDELDGHLDTARDESKEPGKIDPSPHVPVMRLPAVLVDERSDTRRVPLFLRARAGSPAARIMTEVPINGRHIIICHKPDRVSHFARVDPASSGFLRRARRQACRSIAPWRL